MTEDTRMLESCWERVAHGQATEQEIVDTVCLAGKLGDSSSIERIARLLESEHSEVRYYALCTLVLDLDQNDDRIAQNCWTMLLGDDNENVRSMAATCLGSIFSNSKRRDVFERLRAVIACSTEVPLVKGSAYHALFSVVGRPPREWPLLKSRKTFAEDDIDWERIAFLEGETTDLERG